MTIRPATALAAGLLLATPILQAQAPADPVREVALERLLSERGPLEALQRAIKDARDAGISEQAILEARFLYHVDQMEDAALGAMLPDFLERQKHFKLEDSAIFAIEEDWLSVVEYVKAINALQKGDRDGFKRHITEAFWLGPRQAAAFAPHIERLRHEEAMRAIAFDFKTSLPALDGAEPQQLGGLMEGRKALLLHFWSPHSRECIMSMQDFAPTAEMLVKHKLAVVSLCSESGPDALAVAKPYQGGTHGMWLIDSDKDSLGKLLRIQSIPAMALINPEGKVLFCGDPTDIQFWRTLEQIDPTIKRPDIAEIIPE